MVGLSTAESNHGKDVNCKRHNTQQRDFQRADTTIQQFSGGKQQT